MRPFLSNTVTKTRKDFPGDFAKFFFQCVVIMTGKILPQGHEGGKGDRGRGAEPAPERPSATCPPKPGPGTSAVAAHYRRCVPAAGTGAADYQKVLVEVSIKNRAGQRPARTALLCGGSRIKPHGLIRQNGLLASDTWDMVAAVRSWPSRVALAE